MRDTMRWLILMGGILGLLSCATLPEQPGEAQPYALLVLPPDSIRLMALDAQPVDPRARVDVLRVTPGLHNLRLGYIGSSASHAGQEAAPFRLEMQAGHKYLFEAKT